MLRVQMDFLSQSVPDTEVEMERSHLPRVGDEVLWLATTTDPDGRVRDTSWVVREVLWLMGPAFDAERGPDVTLTLEPDTGE